MKLLLRFCVVFILITSCGSRSAENLFPPSELKKGKYKTENVIIIVIDGPRYSETWGDPAHQHVPKMAQLASEGLIFSNFYNEGYTYTNSGHSSIITGNYEGISNQGDQYAQSPSLFQYYLQQSKQKKEKAWIIQSKGKLRILSDCLEEKWEGKFVPSLICGVNGEGSGYRNDEETFNEAINILKQHQPHLVMIGFKEPDHSGHRNDWEGYLEGIKKTDEYVFQLWNFIQSDSMYKDKTSLFVTNDHGRHSDGTADGFVSHGCDCEGCRHINLFAAGPDFAKNKIISTKHELIDISATIAELMGFAMPSGGGRVIEEGFLKERVER